MIKVVVFLATLCVLAAYAVPVLENGIFLTEDENYIISKTRLTFLQAYATCKRYGYTLAVERSAEDTAALNAAIIAAEGKNEYYYIGGYKQTSEDFISEWIWLETGEAIDYAHWFEVEDMSECLVRLDISNDNGTWIPGDCTANVLPFICQKYNYML